MCENLDLVVNFVKGRINKIYNIIIIYNLYLNL